LLAGSSGITNTAAKQKAFSDLSLPGTAQGIYPGLAAVMVILLQTAAPNGKKPNGADHHFMIRSYQGFTMG
jgi:hypothetical protein